jgi:hypothetical protein
MSRGADKSAMGAKVRDVLDKSALYKRAPQAALRAPPTISHTWRYGAQIYKEIGPYIIIDIDEYH